MILLSIFPRFPTQGASSRYRFYLYIHMLMQEDFSIEIESFFPLEYLPSLYSGQRASKSKIFFSYLKRIIGTWNSSKHLWIEYELFPRLPFFFEWQWLKKRRYVLNFDDNVWDNYQNSIFLRGKYNLLVKYASGIIVANDYLYQKIININPKVIKVPTVLDLNAYVNHEKYSKLTIVWIGTPLTYRYMVSYADVFRRLSEIVDYDLLIVASKELSKIEGVSMRMETWSSVKEAELLGRSHIGIMPLVDDGFSIGKSAFKLIQYCAAGIPMVATDIGENSRVLKDGENGFLAPSLEIFFEKLLYLCENKTLREQMGIAAHKQAYEFSLQKYAPIVVDFLKDTFGESR